MDNSNLINEDAVVVTETQEDIAQPQGDDQGRTLESLVSAGGIEEQAEGQAGVGMEELPVDHVDDNR